MRKVVYNACYGGFSLSREAVLLARKYSKNPKWGGATIKGDIYDSGQVCNSDYGYIDDLIARHDPILVKVVEELGVEKAGGSLSNLKIAEVDGPYRIDEYDGFESVETPNSYDWVK